MGSRDQVAAVGDPTAAASAVRAWLATIPDGGKVEALGYGV